MYKKLMKLNYYGVRRRSDSVDSEKASRSKYALRKRSVVM